MCPWRVDGSGWSVFIYWEERSPTAHECAWIEFVLGFHFLFRSAAELPPGNLLQMPSSPGGWGWVDLGLEFAGPEPMLPNF